LGQCFVGREQAAAHAAKGYHTGSRKGRDVDHGARLEALGIGERVAKDQPAFRVGVEDLDGLAAQAGDDVAWLDAAPVGMFSQLGISPTTLMEGRSSPIARKAPSTLAAPPMSNFISSMSCEGLMEMPPLSNVMPLPTSTTGASPCAAPWYFSTIKRKGCSEPLATAMNEPMPILATSLGPSTSHWRPCALASFFASSPSRVGVA